MQRSLFSPEVAQSLRYQQFQQTELGRLRSVLPIKELSECLKKRQEKRGAPARFDNVGKIALQFLKAYLNLSDEKLLARLILASSNPGDMVLDPFLGSGTTCVVAKKLNRKALGIELDLDFALVAQKRLEQAQPDADIQGYSDGVFWARNTLAQQKNTKPAS